MVLAKHFLNLVQSGNAFSARLPIPEHDKTLSANAAVGLGVSICFLAEYLHLDLIRAQDVPRHERDNISVLIWLNIPQLREGKLTSGVERNTRFRESAEPVANDQGNMCAW
jgi:hypothetical protein